LELGSFCNIHSRHFAKYWDHLTFDIAVAERVFQKATHGVGLSFDGERVKVKLVQPWLTDDHDPQRLRVTGFSDNIDTDCLKYFLSALVEVEVLDLLFDADHTKAIAQFRKEIGEPFACLLPCYHCVAAPISNYYIFTMGCRLFTPVQADRDYPIASLG